MTTPLWTFAELAQATGGTFIGAGDGGATDAHGINFDSRALQGGDIFLALQGARDGHDFVPAAFQAGAVVAITRRSMTWRFLPVSAPPRPSGAPSPARSARPASRRW
jgi:UDP-N-acetylmuramyl pentapeptide synthase